VRIGIDTHAAEQDGTGNCTYVRGLVRALLAADRTSQYLLYAIHPEHPFYAEVHSHPNVGVRRLWPRYGVLRVPLALALASYRDRLDVLHVQYVGPPWHRGALVVTIHDLAFLRVPDSFAPLLRWRLRRQVPANARRAAGIITVSEYSKRDIAHTLGIAAERIAVVHDAPDPHFAPVHDEHVMSTLRQRLGIAQRYVLCVGRLNPRKNLLGVLQAFERVRAQLSEPIQLVIAGPRDYRSDHLDAAIAQSPCRQDVIRTGYVADGELPALFSAAAVFVYPSFFEGFGLPPIEAMACGTPVVTSGVTSLPEVVGDAAVIVDPRRPDDIAAALLRVLTDADLRAGLIRKGTARAAHFSWHAAAQQTLGVYRRVAAHPGPRQ
jgi:glycosyltransferase involved in cell wall biosynthesis